MKKFWNRKKYFIIVGIMGIYAVSVSGNVSGHVSAKGQEEVYDVNLGNQDCENESDAVASDSVDNQVKEENSSTKGEEVEGIFDILNPENRENDENVSNKEVQKENNNKDTEADDIEAIRDLSQENKEESEVKMLKKSIRKFMNIDIVEESNIDEDDLSIKDYDLEHAYQVYLLDTLLLSEYSKNQSFSDAITDVCQWKVLITTEEGEDGVVVFNEVDGKLEFSSEIVGNVINHTLWDIEKITELFCSEFGDEAIDNVVYTYSELYNATFIYVTTDKDEYIIPFTNNEDALGLVNGKVYTTDKWFNIMNRRFDEETIAGSKETFGGMSFRENTSDNTVEWRKTVVSYIFSIFAIIGAVVVLTKKKKTQQEDVIE